MDNSKFVYTMKENKPVRTVDAKFNKGDRYKNKNGAVIIVDDPDKFGNVQFKIGGEVKSSTPESFEKMLKVNGYSKDSKSVFDQAIASELYDKAIRACDSVKIEYSDALGDSHTFIKGSVEEAKKWIDSGKFPHGAAFNIKIDGVLYKKEAR